MGSLRIFKGAIYFNTLGIWRISSSSFSFSFKHTVLISIQFNRFWFSHFILSIKLMMSWPTSFPAIFWWFHVARQNRMLEKIPLLGLLATSLYLFFFFFQLDRFVVLLSVSRLRAKPSFICLAIHLFSSSFLYLRVFFFFFLLILPNLFPPNRFFFSFNSHSAVSTHFR